MRPYYEAWLRRQGYDEGTIKTQLYRVARVTEHHGELDQHYDKDRCESLIFQLSYSVEDKRRGRPNPSNIPSFGDIRNNLASYKSAVLWYKRFRGAGEYIPAEKACSLKTGSGVGELTATRPFRPLKRVQFEIRTGARTLVDFGLNGRAALEAIVATSQYRTVEQAVASLTLFSHPDTVRQTGGKALFPAIRNPRRVGQIDEHEGRTVLLDDNRSPTAAFRWANGLTGRNSDVQLNHVYTASLDVDAYTALPNLCMTPAFIAKLTDTSEEVRALLQYRSYQLFGWTPKGFDIPSRPESYEVLEWAAPLPAIGDLKGTLEHAMDRKPKDRTVLAARQLGWLFS